MLLYRNMPRSTLGTLATAVVSMLSLTAMFGIVPNNKLANATRSAAPRAARSRTPRRVLAVVFSILFIFYSRNAGHSFWLVSAPFFLFAAALLLGVPVYNKQRGHMTEPAAAPPYRTGTPANTATQQPPQETPLDSEGPTPS